MNLLDRLEGNGSFTASVLPNPFRVPPEGIVMGGIKATKDYFKALYANAALIERRDIKTVIVGKEGVGKTR